MAILASTTGIMSLLEQGHIAIEAVASFGMFTELPVYIELTGQVLLGLLAARLVWWAILPICTIFEHLGRAVTKCFTVIKNLHVKATKALRKFFRAGMVWLARRM